MRSMARLRRCMSTCGLRVPPNSSFKPTAASQRRLNSGVGRQWFELAGRSYFGSSIGNSLVGFGQQPHPFPASATSSLRLRLHHRIASFSSGFGHKARLRLLGKPRSRQLWHDRLASGCASGAALVRGASTTTAAQQFIQADVASRRGLILALGGVGESSWAVPSWVAASARWQSAPDTAHKRS